MNTLVRAARQEDLELIAHINSQVFNGNNGFPEIALRCVQDWWQSSSSHHLFVAQREEGVVGYISWREEGGEIREQPVVELDQLGIHPAFYNNGFGTLLLDSIYEVKGRIIEKNFRLGPRIVAVVWAYEDNEPALTIYKRFFSDGEFGRRNQYGRPEVGYKKIISVP